MCRSSFVPYETDPPLIVDADRMLPSSVGPECLESIARRDTKIVEHSRLVQQTKLAQGDILDVRWEFTASSSSQTSSVSGSAKFWIMRLL
jgi:hypothetical protein